MNLFYLIAKKNSRLSESAKAVTMRRQRGGLTWRGVQIDNEGGSIHIARATECQPFRSRQALIGWYAQSLGDSSDLGVRFKNGAEVVSERRITVAGDSFEPLVLPWPVEPTEAELDLEISCSGQSPAFLASHFELDRKALFNRCQGDGVELGPGPSPHIRLSNGRQVFYVEQKSPNEWAELYGDHYKVGFDPALVPFYVVGDAHQIPVEPGSLDFIYCSHVFEHLVNPLGHLEIWSSLLRGNGQVLMVIPDYIGSKDYLADPSTMAEILTEYGAGTFTPSLGHYHKYASARGAPDTAQKLFDSGSSIHMHYYSNDNMQQLLARSVKDGFFRSYTILHSPNAKDFHVILLK